MSKQVEGMKGSGWMKQMAAAILAVLSMGSALWGQPNVTVGGLAPAPALPPEAPPGARMTPEGWFAPAQPTERPPLPKRITDAFVIPIHGPIGSTTFEAVQRKAAQAMAKEAQIVIFDLNTPGGDGEAMRKIVRVIIDDMRNVYTVAYVNPEAYSAGAIIALACNEIVIAPTGVIGDAMPIMIGAGGELVPMPPEERGKAESGILGLIRNLAERSGYNVALCEGMVTMKMELWLIRNRQSRQLQIVDIDEWRRQHGKAAGGENDKAPTALDGNWEYVRTIDAADKLVTLTADEAVFDGLAAHVFKSMDELEKHFAIESKPTVLSDTWSEELVTFLTSPWVTGILFFLGLLLVYVEMHSPGFGVAGVGAIVCFALLFGSRFLVGMANWWEIALFIIGAALVLVELIALPGHGFLAVIGGVMCVASLLGMLIYHAPNQLPIPRTELDWQMFTDTLFAMGAGFVGALVAAAFLARYLAKMPLLGRLVLPPMEVAPEPPVPPDSPVRQVRVGDVGVTETMCRPVGKVRFGDALVDAASQGEIIEPGTKVRVLGQDGSSFIVEKA